MNSLRDYLNIINESMESFLYHGSPSVHAGAIIRDNEIKDFTTHFINGKRYEGVSLSRDKRMTEGWGSACFVLDHQKLKMRYKILQIRDKTDRKDMFEEFCVGSIKPLDKYLVSILMAQKAYDKDINTMSKCSNADQINMERVLNHPLLKII